MWLLTDFFQTWYDDTYDNIVHFDINVDNFDLHSRSKVYDKAGT